MTERLFGYPPNRDEWKRLVTAIDLHEGFALFIVVVPDEVVAEVATKNLQELAATLGISVERYSLFGPQSVISSLLAQEPTHASFVIVDLVASSWRAPDPERLAVALMQMNQRRDLIRDRVTGPLLVFVDREGRRSLVDHAPDLFSIHAAEFRFSHGIRVSSVSLAGFMLGDYEAAGLLGWVPGFLDTEPSLVPSLVAEIPEWIEGAVTDAEWQRLAGQIVFGARLDYHGDPQAVVAYLRSTQSDWDVVVWNDATNEPNDVLVPWSMIEALAPASTVPRTMSDLRDRFMAMTEAQRVLVVVVGASAGERIATIGARSALIYIDRSLGGRIETPLDGFNYALSLEYDENTIIANPGRIEHRKLLRAFALAENPGVPGTLPIDLPVERAILRPAPWKVAVTKAYTHWTFLAARTLFPEERPAFFTRAARTMTDEGVRHRIIEAMFDEQLRLHRRPSDAGLRLSTDRRIAAALQRHEATLADVPFDPASSPSARVVDLLRRVDTSTLITEFPLDAVYAPPLDHFIAVGHAWHALRSERSDELRVALARVRASAEQWGDPIALIRADLLDAEAQALAGDIQRSLATLDRLDARFDALFDPRGSEAIWLLQRRATLNERLGLYANAIELANEAWTRLRYVEVDDPDVLGQLARLFARHERSERALLALERWKLLAKDSPEQLLEALELEKQLLAKTNEAKLEAIDAQIAGLKRSVDAPS